jgi:hypothetical protein
MNATTDLTPKMARTLERLRADKADADANSAPILAFSGGYNYGTIKALRARGFVIGERTTHYGVEFAIA